jgi:alanyl-tRNA synthetase
VDSKGEATFSHRIIADHLRATSFLIADGVLPSNEGRGYVLRRIMRRGMRHAHLLGTKDPLMHRLVPALVAEMGSAYPELQRGEGLITETLKLEEIRFRETLARGLKLLDEASVDLKKGDRLKGEIAFKLYDTYGFPLDLTEESLRARGITVDTDGFSAAMQKQKAEARASWTGSGEAASEAQWFAVLDEVGRTEFLGYDTEEAEGAVLAIFKDGGRVMAAQAGDAVEIVTNQTPFYGESGGQAGDTGHITSAKAKGQVTDTQKWLGALLVHSVRVTEGTFAPGDVVDLKVDPERRRATRANHSATHLLHAALKRVLGSHVSQKGSLVTAERLRFDYSHPKPTTAEELERIEAQVNAVIRQNSDTTTRLMATDQAIAAGAEALFGEKYGDEVRVLSMGSDADKAYSVELCGGTHVHRLGDIGLFTILSESAVAAGVRRIEALTSEHARRYLAGQAEIAREAASAIKTPIGELAGRVAQLAEERRRLERELAEAKKQLALAGPAQGAGDSGVETIAGLKTVLRLVEGVSPKDLKSLADGAKSQVGSGVVAFVAAADGKASIVAGVTEDLTSRINAVDLVRVAAEALGGKGGGGRPDMAQAGGPDNGNPSVALDAIRKKLGELAAV